jgi:hypothetical protein
VTNLTASDKSALIKLASSLPAGDESRRAILAGFQKPKIDRKTREFIATEFNRAGLDGNGRFAKPDKGYVAAVDALSDFGIEIDEVVNAHSFAPRPSGSLHIALAFTNQEDSFSPVSIPDTELIINYHELAPGRFEVLAYLS